MRNAKTYRGSRKHILDWTAIEGSRFRHELLALLGCPDVTIEDRDVYQPRGYLSPDEVRLDRASDDFLPPEIRNELRVWWLRHPVAAANTPNWDLVCACRIGDRRGLILVEAKANEAELSSLGKLLPTKRAKSETSAVSNVSQSDDLKRSRENHERIAAAIAEAQTELQAINPGFRIHRDSHYQFANRVAFSWKLATLGVPTVLVYLGFVGDDGISDVGAPLHDDAHWQALMRSHIKSQYPLEMIGTTLACGPSSTRLLVRTRQMLAPSPSVSRTG